MQFVFEGRTEANGCEGEIKLKFSIKPSSFDKQIKQTEPSIEQQQIIKCKYS